MASGREILNKELEFEGMAYGCSIRILHLLTKDLVKTRDGLDIRKISDIQHIQLFFQCPKYRQICGLKLPDIWLYIAHHFFALQVQNRLITLQKFSEFVF